MRRALIVGITAGILGAFTLFVPATASADTLPVMPGQTQHPGAEPIQLSKKAQSGADETKRIVVLFMQNNSFDKLFGSWGSVNGDPVDGISNAKPKRTTQVNQNGKALECLLMNDVNLAPDHLAGPATCTDSSGVKSGLYPKYSSPFANAPFALNGPLPAGAMTCPIPGNFPPNGFLTNSPFTTPGGCTRDMVHRFYQEQYALNGGKMNRYATANNGAGLVMGHYKTKQLRTYKYLTSSKAPKYAIADRFFTGVFGGSFINGQFVMSATVPEWASAPASIRSVLDVNGMVASQSPATATNLGQYNYYLSPTPKTVVDGIVTQSCDTIPVPNLACGDYVVNTVYTVQWPYMPGTPNNQLMPLLTYDNIGDRLNAAGIDWAYYSGGWANANGYRDMPGWTNGDGPTTLTYETPSGVSTNTQGCPDPTAFQNTTWPLCPDADFQFHHQAFNYFYNWSTETAATTANRMKTLRDTVEFNELLKDKSSCKLKQVSYVQQLGERNMHPGYASAYVGDEQISQALKGIYNGPCAKHTLTIITYDEFGGSWDHVQPPGTGKDTPGAHDKFGPGTRIPSVIISNDLPRSGVDSTTSDLASVVGTITAKYGLDPVNSRDTKQATVWNAWKALAKN